MITRLHAPTNPASCPTVPERPPATDPLGASSSDLDRARDPSLPWDDLVDLWIDHPQAILENPILSLKCLTEARPLHEIIPRAVCASLYVHLTRHGDPDQLERYVPHGWRRGEIEELRGFRVEESLVHELAVSNPRLLDDYAGSLAKDPARDVRTIAAEYLPLHLIEPFLGDADLNVRLAIVHNLKSQNRCLSDHYYNRRSGGSPLSHWGPKHIKGPEEVKRDFRRIAWKLLRDHDEEVRVANLAESYSDDDMFQHALGNEDEAFFLKFACRRNWRGWHYTSGGIPTDSLDGLFVRYPSIARVALGTSNPSSLLIWKLTQHEDPGVAEHAWKQFRFSWNFPEEVALEDYQRLRRENFRVSWFENLARKEKLPHELHGPLWNQGGTVRQALFENPRPIPKVAYELLDTLTVEELIPYVAEKRSEVLVKAAIRHPDPRLRAIVAGFPGKPFSTLRRRFARDPDPLVRSAVADYYLSTTINYPGRHYNETLSELTADPDPAIRLKICRDHRLKPDDVAALLNDPVPEVAIKTLRSLPWNWRIALPLFSVADAAIRREAASIVLGNREGIIYEPDSKPFLREFEGLLIRDPDPGVRSLLAADPWTTPRTCWSLMEDDSPEVRRALVRGFEEAGRCKAREEFLFASRKEVENLSRSRNPWYRACLLRWYQKDPVRGHYLARDSHWFVRAVAASSRRLRDSLREELLSDRERVVREIAGNRVR